MAGRGWWTGIDIGRLCFTMEGLGRVFRVPNPDPLPLLADDRWYQSIDKEFRGRAVSDPNGQVAPLVGWFTAHRFDPGVVALRLKRDAAEVDGALRRLDEVITEGDILAGYVALFDAVKWLRIGWLER